MVFRRVAFRGISVRGVCGVLVCGVPWRLLFIFCLFVRDNAAHIIVYTIIPVSESHIHELPHYKSRALNACVHKLEDIKKITKQHIT